MSVKSFFGSLFKGMGALVQKAFAAAVTAGITDEVLKLAIEAVKKASVKYTDNTDKREWAVKELGRLGLPESLARLAVEMAVRLFKAELNKLG